MRVFGFDRAGVEFIEGHFEDLGARRIVRYALAILKSNMPWDTVRYFLGTDVRRLTLKFLKDYDWSLDATVRFAMKKLHKMDPTIRGSVDVFPVCTPQDKERKHYTGKYKGAVRKYELWVTNGKIGLPFALYGPYPGKMHDSVCLTSPDADGSPKFTHGAFETFLADKAYVGKRHLLVPRKNSKKNPITVREKRFERHHRKYRSRVEHAIGRLNRFRFIRWCTLHDDTLDAAMRFVTWCEHVVMCRRFGLHSCALPQLQCASSCNFAFPPIVRGRGRGRGRGFDGDAASSATSSATSSAASSAASSDTEGDTESDSDEEAPVTKKLPCRRQRGE